MNKVKEGNDKYLIKKIGQSSLTLEEKGMIIVLSSLEPGQMSSLSVQELQNNLNDRPGKITRVLRSLEHKGIVQREQERDAQGQFSNMRWKINF